MTFEVTKKYHFYAGHRNQYLVGSKCVNPHGHTYKVEFTFEFPASMADSEDGVTIPFEGFDNAIEPIIKELDHTFFVDKNDTTLLEFFKSHNFKVVVFNGASSVEHLCTFLHEALKAKDPQLHSVLKKVTVRETESSVVTLNL
jgi:6-pyruvoyl-tetrahydropterin synthase